MALQGSERKVLHAILREQRDEAAGYVDDASIARNASLPIDEVRDCLETLAEAGCVQRSVGTDGHSAYITAKGRLELRRPSVVGVDEGGAPQPTVKIVPKGLR
jgi:hypothetical protein